MTSPTAGAPLTPQLIALIAHIATRLGSVAALVEAQAAEAVVVAESPTMLDFRVPPTKPAIPLPDGPLPVRAIVQNASQQAEGEVLVWIRSGVLIGIEQAWFTDEPPTRWPDASRVRLS